MRVLLIQTKTLFDEPPIFPLGLASIGAILVKKGYRVYTLDLNIGLGGPRSIERAIRRIRPDVIGVSIRNIKNARPGIHRSSMPDHQRMLKDIRSAAPDAVIVTGGSGFSLYAEQLMDAIPEIDFGVFAEAEETFPKLLSSLNSPRDIPGVYVRNGSEIIFTGRHNLPDFPSLPLPKRSLFDVPAYMNASMGIGIQAKRGCVLDCIHCSNHYLFEKRLRVREPGAVVDEIESLIKDYGLRQFVFADEIFNIPDTHAREICEHIIRRNLQVSWTGWFKEKQLSEESALLFKRAGCYALLFSPDVAADQLFSLWGKGLTEADLYRSMEIVDKTGLRAEWNFMLNGPGETWNTAKKMAVFLGHASIKLKRRMHASSYVPVSLRIYPHSRVQDVAIERGLISGDDELVDPVHYNPPPISRVANPIIFAMGSAWRARQFLRSVLKPGGYRD